MKTVLFGDIRLTLSASALAWYAAIIGTFAGIKAFSDLWNDRGRIKIQYKPGMVVINTRGMYDENKKYFSTEVINKGRRPVKITHVGAKFFDQKETSLFADSFLEGTDRTLTESHPATTYLTDQTDFKLEKLWFVYAIDAKGKEYREYASELPLIWKIYFRARNFDNNVKMRKANMKTVLIGDVCKIINGFAFKSTDYIENGARVIRINNVQKGRIIDSHPRYIDIKRTEEFKRFIISKDDLLMSLTGNVGRVGMFPSFMQPAVLNQRVAKIIPDNRKINKKLLFYFLNSDSFEMNAISHSRGSAQLNLSTEWLKKVEIVLPPIERQEQIAKILDNKFAAIEKAKYNIETNLRNCQELFESALDDLNNFADHRCALKMLCEIDRKSNKKSSLRFVGMEDIHSVTGKIDLSSKPTRIKGNSYHFNESHILYGRLRPYLRKVAVPSFEGHCSTEIFPLKVLPVADKHYVKCLLLSRGMTRRIERTCTGTRMPRAKMDEVMGMDVPAPDANIQRKEALRIQEIFEQTQQIQELYLLKLAALRELRQAILKQAFEGRL